MSCSKVAILWKQGQAGTRRRNASIEQTLGKGGEMCNECAEGRVGGHASLWVLAHPRIDSALGTKLGFIGQDSANSSEFDNV